MELSIKGLVTKFLNEVNELKDEPVTKEQIDELGSVVEEIQTKTNDLVCKMRGIIGYEYARLQYTGAIDGINELIKD